MSSPYYAVQLERGLQYQDFVTDYLQKQGITITNHSSRHYQHTRGENKAGMEIKFDGKRKTTGNLYIEVAEKTDRDNPYYVQSGIWRECTEYVIGDYEIIYRLPILQLRKVYHLGTHREIEIKMRTSKGFCLPEKTAQLLAIAVYYPTLSQEQQNAKEADRLNQIIASSEAAQVLGEIKHSGQKNLFD